MNVLAKKERNIGLDILRILSMFLITARHYIGYSGVTESLGFSSLNGIFVNVLSVTVIPATNIFVLISGYFLVNSAFKPQRIVKIWAETFFYSVLFFIVGLILNFKRFSLSNLIFALLPFVSRHYWFSVTYIVLILVSPFLNKVIISITEKEHRLLVVGGGILLSGWTTIVYFSQGVVTGGNRGLLWFMYLYLIGAYINLYREKIKFNAINIIVTVFSFVVILAYNFLLPKLSFISNFPINTDDSVFSLILSVALFVAFLNIRINNKKIKEIVVALAASSFGVYLIQENCMIRYFLWQDTVNANKFADSILLFVVLLVCFVVLLAMSYCCEKIFSVIYGKSLEKLKRIAKVKR